MLVDAHGRPITPPDLEEIATTNDGRDVTRGYVDALDYLRPQDKILEQRCRGDWEVYEELLRDDQVQPAWQQRRLAVVSHEWVVEPASEEPADVEAADFVREQLAQVELDRITFKMLSGVFFGYSVGECLWGEDSGRVVLRDIRVRKQRRFRFSPKGELLLLTTRSPRGEVMPDRKFWIFSCGADDDDEPYGRGLAHHLYWPCFFKRNGLRYWANFLDKFGDPTVIGKYGPGATPEEKQLLKQVVAAVRNDSGITMPESMQITLLESARSAGGDFGAFVDRMDASIAKVIVSQTMTTDDGSSLAQSKTHLSVRDQVVKSDADLLCASFNAQVIAWLVDWNFPGSQPPQVWRRFVETEDLGARAHRDVAVSQLGYRPTIDEVREVYGGEWEPMPQAAAPSGMPEFAEGEEEVSNTPELLEAKLERAAAPALEQMIEEVRALLEESTSLEEVRDRLIDIYASVDPAGLADALAGGLLVADLTGRAEAADA